MRHMISLLIFQLVAICQAHMGPVDAPAHADNDPGVTYLDTSFEAEESLERVRLLEEDGRWADAAKQLQFIGRKFGGHVVTQSAGRYVAIRTHVNRRIAAWPAEGLAAYRAAFESAAASRLATVRSGKDPREYLLVADEYFACKVGAEALDLAAQLLIERGDFQQAREAYQLLLEAHPDREHQAAWRVKSAIVAALCGEPAELEAEAMAEAPASAEVSWMGRAQTADAFARERLEELRRQVDGRAEGAVGATTAHQLGADNLRRGFFAATSTPEARLWKVEIAGELLASDGEGKSSILDDPSLAETFARALQSGKLVNTIPVTGGGLVYFHDGRKVWAIDPARSDAVVWTFGGEDATLSSWWLHEDSVAPLSTALYADGRLYVSVLDVRAGAGDKTEPAGHGHCVVCLDAATGRLIWRNDLDAFHSEFEEAELDGSPILHNGDLFVVGRRRKSFGFEACYLLRLKPEDGRLTSMIHLAEAATGSYGYRRATVSLPAASGDLVFVQTNLGAIAAVSTALDRVAWIYTYRTSADQGGDPLWPERGGRAIRSWNYQPVMVWRDAIVCMPLDTTGVFVLGQRAGDLREPIGGEALHAPQMLLGIAEDRLYVVGNEVACYDLSARRVVWQRPFELGQLNGRGCLTETGLMIPMDRALLTYPLDGGKAQVLPWKIGEAGNLVPFGEQVIVAPPGMVYGLSDRANVFDMLTRREAERPDDAAPCMALAELALNSGQYERGLASVEEAVRRVGGFARLTDDATRRRLFDQLMSFATMLDAPDSRGGKGPAATDAAIALFGMAGQCAPGPEDYVRQRFRLAGVLAGAGRAAEAVGSYQRVLGDPALRRLTIRLTLPLTLQGLVGESRSAEAAEMSVLAPMESVVAGAHAADAIERLIAAHGASVYAAVEAQAENRLKIAEADADAARILEVAESFPNGAVATAAYAAHADLLRGKGEFEAASRSFRRALEKRNFDGRASVICRYVECLVSAGRTSDAAEWIDRLERDYPRFEPRHSGRRVSGAAYRRVVLGDERFGEPRHSARPGAGRETYKRLFAEKAVVLDPVFDDLPHTTWDSMLVAVSGQVEARHAVTGRGLWPRPLGTKSLPSLLGMDASRFILSTPWRIFAVTRTSGQVSWAFGNEPDDDPMLEPEETSPWSQQILMAERLYCASDRGQIVCVELSDGTVRWSLRAESSLAGPIAVDERYLCFPTWQGSELVVTVVNADTGKALRTLRPSDAWPMQAMRMTRRHRLLIVRSTSIQCFDLDASKSEWIIQAPDHFTLSTLQLDSDSLYVSPDGRRVNKYDLDDGRLVWSSSAIGKASDQAIWVGRSRGVLYIAGQDRLEALDCADGHGLWSASAPGCLGVQSPRLAADSIITISAEPQRRQARAVEDEVDKDRRVYRICRYSLETGARLSMKDGESAVTEPVGAFGGLHVRDKAVILLDGSMLIGYVDGKPE
ncbi:hypothetical protein B7486_00640 [cyanobacterium TDX16]|nr:hypothetical protein B7486_00640 [cyanobacterium TDX16]